MSKALSPGKAKGHKYFGELAAWGYTSVEVFGVETDRATAHEQALSRWWEGRRRWAGGKDPLGGRFMPPAFIDMCYSGTAQSLCSANALKMIDIAQSGEIPNLHVRIFGRQPNGTFKQLSDTAYHR